MLSDNALSIANSINNLLELIQSVFTIISTIAIIYLSYLAAKFAAKPKIRVRMGQLKNDEKELECNPDKIEFKKVIELEPEEIKGIVFYIENIGHRYSAKPAATNIKLWVNFDPKFELIKMKYGSNLEKMDSKLKRGVGGSKYFRAEGIHLFHREPGECLWVVVKAPLEPGLYKIWISAHADQGDCGVHEFRLKVKRL